MRIVFVFFIAIALVACATTEKGSGAPQRWEIPLNDEEKLHIADVAEEGQLLYRKDQYAARATRLLLDAVDLADYPDFVGWVGYGDERTYIVSFYERTDDEVTLVADVHFSVDGTSRVEPNPGRAIGENEFSMLMARIVALEEGSNSCSNRFNTVVMPSRDDDDTWMVYVLAATTDPNAIVVGGHSRVRVAKVTAEVLDVERMSHSCLTLDKSEMERRGSEGALVFVTHHATPMPVPVHPFLSLLHRQPIIVLSERGRWSVEGSRISLL